MDLRVLQSRTRLLVLGCAMMAATLLAIASVALADTFRGTDGPDKLVGTNGNDYMDSGRGNDNLEGRRGADRMIGGFGNDYVNGGFGSNDRLDGGAGADKVYGGAGNDPVVDGGSGSDPLVTGGSGNDYVTGFRGNDKVYGFTGADKVRGGPGDDEIYGGDGNDFIIEAKDPHGDVINCGAGRDRVHAHTLDQVHSNCESVLKISTNNNSDMAGQFSRNGTTIKFNGNVVQDGGTKSGAKPYSKEVASSITVAGIKLTSQFNPETGEFTRTSSDKVLSRAQKRQIVEGGAELVRYLDMKNYGEATNHRALVLRDLAYYSEAPAGYKFERRSQETW